LGIGGWGLGLAPNPQSPIPNPQSPIPKFNLIILFIKIKNLSSFQILKYFIDVLFKFFSILIHFLENKFLFI